MDYPLIEIFREMLMEKAYKSSNPEGVEMTICLTSFVFHQVTHEIAKYSHGLNYQPEWNSKWIKFNYAGNSVYVINEGPETKDSTEFMKQYNLLVKKQDV